MKETINNYNNDLLHNFNNPSKNTRKKKCRKKENIVAQKFTPVVQQEHPIITRFRLPLLSPTFIRRC